MLEKKIESVRQILLTEIVATLEYISYLKNEVKVPVKKILLQQKAKKLVLVAELKALELLAY